VFLGGVSAEREVSLRTGAGRRRGAPAEGARRPRDRYPRGLAGRGRDAGVDAAFIALHGRFGEDGCIQAACELARLPYTGSGVAASAIAMSKMLGSGWPPRPASPALRTSVRGAGDPRGETPAFGFPLVVKPDREGSTVGITIVRNAAEWEGALALAARHDSRVLAEGYVAGREITVSIVNGRVFPAIEIVPKSGFYDYESKYTAGRRST